MRPILTSGVLTAAAVLFATSASAFVPTLTDAQRKLVAEGVLTVTQPAEPFKTEGDAAMLSPDSGLRGPDDQSYPSFYYPDLTSLEDGGVVTTIKVDAAPLLTFVVAVWISCTDPAERYTTMAEIT